MSEARRDLVLIASLLVLSAADDGVGACYDEQARRFGALGAWLNALGA